MGPLVLEIHVPVLDVGKAFSQKNQYQQDELSFIYKSA